jgi:chemotaxis protein MotA
VQLVGFLLLAFVVWLGFSDLGHGKTISAFDLHALVMVLVGSAAAVLASSSGQTALRTVLCLREIIPGVRKLPRESAEMEAEREQFSSLWHDGKRSQALAMAEKSRFKSIKQILDLVVNRAPEVASSKVFLELRHEEIAEWQPAINNWEMLSKLGPAFGMVGTITGMVQLFSNMSSDNLNIGAAMSLALLSTLYGISFGAGVAGPIGHFLNGLLDQRLGFLDRCEKTANDLVARSAQFRAETRVG